MTLASWDPAGKRVVLITGCTPGGIGHSLAKEFHAQGLHVIATARNEEVLKDLKAAGMSTLALDVTSQESIDAAKNFVDSKTGGRLDILVNNAGMTYFMPAIHISPSSMATTFNTNLFGAISLTVALAPLMIQTSSQLPTSTPRPVILQIGSVSGIVPFAFSSIYNATKAAMHSYSETLRLELEPFGVRVSVAVTGGIKSNITAPTKRSVVPEGSPYAAIADAFARRQVMSQVGAMDTDAYAKYVVRKVLAKNPSDQVWAGNGSFSIWFFKTFLGAWVWKLIVPSMFSLNILKEIILAQRRKKEV